MTDKPTRELSRRDAIKIIAAAAGAAVLANIPAEWVKPDLEVGAIPAHAQTSGRAIAAGASDPDANFCFPLISTAAIIPPEAGIVLRYVITPSPGITILVPASLTGTIPTDGAGSVSLAIEVDTSSFNVGDTVTVTWSFDNPADGTDSDAQVFTSGGSGC
ncbi:MAG: hypothetical protein DPW18_16980 [Chloroflexi bacterium]|nr:hypothetical protein [Chloroflexota bacterium]MDL1940719.1 twin-arginine translocation signal domain-containing protein [Chloroflexi bacterium CFX2]